MHIYIPTVAILLNLQFGISNFTNPHSSCIACARRVVLGLLASTMASPPSSDATSNAVALGKELLAALKNTPKDDIHRCTSMRLYHNIRKLAENPLVAQLHNFMDSCVRIMAAYAHLQVDEWGAQGWNSIGFKYLSSLGYEPDGLRQIDYGNVEYLAVLQFLSLGEPAILDALESLRCHWPTYMDLWAENKSNGHVEQLADVVEIVMGALRGEVWFEQLFKPEKQNDLPKLFNVLVDICKLVQHLDARLLTGVLKHKHYERIPKFPKLAKLEFVQRWSDIESRGLLIFGLFDAIRFGA